MFNNIKKYVHEYKLKTCTVDLLMEVNLKYRILVCSPVMIKFFSKIQKVNFLFQQLFTN